MMILCFLNWPYMVIGISKFKKVFNVIVDSNPSGGPGPEICADSAFLTVFIFNHRAKVISVVCHHMASVVRSLSVNLLFVNLRNRWAI